MVQLYNHRRLTVRALLAILLTLGLSARAAEAQPHQLCDPGQESCRAILIDYIRAETVGIDVAFWFMEDARYTTELILKWRAGVPVRVLVDSRANPAYPANAERLRELRDAGIPMRERFVGGILHWKLMLFSNTDLVQFSGANYSSDAWRPEGAPYTNYTDEAILFTRKPSIVGSFRKRFDDLWTDTTSYRDYANITAPPTRRYPDFATFTKDPELNFPPGESFSGRSTTRYGAETQKIDVIMYRITDQRHTNAMIAAEQRGVPVRLITEPEQYRDPNRLWHSWNVDRLHMAGVEIKHRVHAGLNHQKSVILYGQTMAILGSSNWTSPSSNSQEEHNLFTKDPYIYQWFVDQFERKWNNSTGVAENGPFVPLPPDAPKTPTPVNLATAVPINGVTLTWYGGPFAHVYDVYFGTDPNNLSRVGVDLPLGPSESLPQKQSFRVNTTLIPGTTYYWQVVAKTMALQTRASVVWRFVTEGTAPPQPTATIVREPYLQHTTSTSTAVVWATREAGPAEVRYAVAGGATLTVPATSTLVPMTTTGLANDYYQHVARLSGLAPSTTYQYDIIVNTVDANPLLDSFRTAPATGSGTVSFIAFGDSGTGSTQQRQLASLMSADTFDFALHGGDIAYGASNGTGDASYATYDSWFFGIYRWLRARPMFTAVGNHDSRASTADGRAYLDLFVLPENGTSTTFPDHRERYYSFDYGPVHVVVLDTELAFQGPDTTRRSEQLAWLQADLASTTQPWKVALFHRSPFSAGGEHGSDLEVRAAFAPIFEQHGVQLALSAHEHTYERTLGWRGDAADPTGVTYIVSGGGGGPLYPSSTAAWTAHAASRHHYVKATASECILSVNAIGLDGSVFDTVSLQRCVPPDDTAAPNISITAPVNGATARGNLAVTTSATDDRGVASVELFVDGVSVAVDSAAPFAFSWDSTTVANGPHQLTARALDAAGNAAVSAAVTVAVNNAQTGPGDIVLFAADATVVAGSWVRQVDATAAGGALLRNPDAARAKLSAPLASPSSYFELTFTAEANVPYHLWIRSKADNNHYLNDSIFIQFSDTQFPIGGTTAVDYNLEDCSGCKLSGWGWQDNGWGVGVSGPHITFNTSGTHTLRIQPREDGISIDQIILSPQTFLTAAPGALKNDATIYPRASGETGPPPDPDTQNPVAAINAPVADATVSGNVPVAVTATDNIGVSRVELLLDGAVISTRDAAPFDFMWDSRSVPNGAHTLAARAYDAAGNPGVSSDVTVTVDNTVAPPGEPREIVIWAAAEATAVFGAWQRQASATAAGAQALRHPDARAAKRSAPLANPVDYVEFTVDVVPNVPYHLWIRGRADGDGWNNDSIYIQFTGMSSYGVGSTSAVEMNLEDCSGCGLQGWGWQDNGWGVGVTGPDLMFTTGGTQTIRIQSREDGISLDQIVLSPVTYRTSAPGGLKNDTVILPQSR